ncbi:MAG: DUF438 domain-containing protein [Chlorobi bacterium]|nr:DUF438 domain-containing protein [Chlorobiota bacterium]
MSEFTQNYKQRVEKLTNYTIGLIEGKNGLALLKEFQILETSFLPQDIIQAFDNIFEKVKDIEKIKTASNKLFNILYKNLSKLKKYNYPKSSLINYLIEDNTGVKKHLAHTGKNIKLINQKQSNDVLSILIKNFVELEGFTSHYTIIENIIFPAIEKKWGNYQCLKLMWSFHDDIRKNIKKSVEILKTEPFDLQLFNKFSSKVYFNINTIAFREESVLFPVMYETFEKDTFQQMLSQIDELNLQYVNIKPVDKKPEHSSTKEKLIKLSTGEMSLEQIELVFNHLPVDITFVDENEKVKFFSTPRHRIFPRTTGIIGRTVQNCHPHESVEIVNKIINSFKTGEKDVASFWIKMKDNFVLIQYFAVRDKNNNYKGVLEVSQEISEIQKIEGERRLLDW